MAKTLEQRLQELEDREAIRQAICGYGYAAAERASRPTICPG